MEAAIKQRIESKNPGEVTTLVLDELKIKEITPHDANILAQYVELRNLSCNRTGLHSLANLPPLMKLTTLELTDNFLNDHSSLETLAQYTELESLSLSGNKIKSLECLQSLAALKKLVNLELELNPFTETNRDYRSAIFAGMPSLRIIDDRDREGRELELESSDEEDEAADRSARKNLIKEFYEKDEMSDDEEDDEEYNPMAEDDEESSDSSNSGLEDEGTGMIGDDVPATKDAAMSDEPIEKAGGSAVSQ